VTPDLDAHLRTNNHIAKLRMIAEIHAHWNDIVTLAIERATGPGAREYGDASFHKPPHVLRQERFEEYADALFYFQTEQKHGG
jgi:hypothetical protein